MKKTIFLVLVAILHQFCTLAQTPLSSDSVLKILAIGNSFSEDGIENYLYELASVSGKKIIIGNMYIGGAPLSLHVKNARANAASYSYRKIDISGKKVVTNQTSVAQALSDENWDYISFQQASPLSGQYQTIVESLPELVTYVRGKVGALPQFVYHQTWAYQQDATHEGFKNYNSDQLTMYKAIVNASKQVAALGYFAHIIPAGTAVQNARSSSLGDTFTRDGYHLQLDYGRFTAACTWYEMLFGQDVRKNTYKPSAVSEIQAEIAKAAAHKAVKKPYKISKIKR
ncbi:DUF4886 domain-containing protein [Sphingobacterium suaedae]|uniref:DUF4886 domain-containing protein n=1 Tax=Sphingobacterium suaedae TaxID=1686402 RepID=A0ABW5KMV8_9SPHI